MIAPRITDRTVRPARQGLALASILIMAMALAAPNAPVRAAVIDSTWTVDGDDVWTEADHWTDGVPDGVGHIARFDESDFEDSPHVARLDRNIIIGTLDVLAVDRGTRTLGSIQTGSVVMTARYDGLGRRIVKAVKNSADLDATYHYHYHHQQLIETRNGSDLVLKQHVWGLEYVDELVQIALNDDPVANDDCESVYFALHNANYNVMALVDAAGAMVERYEYSPYGQRQVYFSPGANDPGAHAPIAMSRRWSLTGGGTAAPGDGHPYGLNDFGHQGLMHDEHTRLVHNRARTLHPKLGRFMQRDPAGYIDGMSLYQYVRSNPLNYLDPLGLACTAQLRVTDAFGVPGAALIGAAHVGLELCRDGEKTLIELQAYEDARHGSENRVGHGPLGPTMYAWHALDLEAQGHTDNSLLRRINDISRRLVGKPAMDVIDHIDNVGVDRLGFGPHHWYGLYVTPGLEGRGRKIPIELGAGACAALDALEQAARDIGAETINGGHMALPVQRTILGVDVTITVTRQVGYGYDFAWRNSSAFIGSVIRDAGVQAPAEAAGMIGFQYEFTEWMWWDDAIQEMFRDAAGN